MADEGIVETGVEIGLLAILVGIVGWGTYALFTAPTQSSAENEPTKAVQTLSPADLTALLTPSVTPTETPVPTSTMALSQQNNQFIMPTAIIDYDNCFKDAYENEPVIGYKVNVIGFRQKIYTAFPYSDDSYLRTATIIRTETKEGSIDQLFIFLGDKDFSLTQPRIEFDYWKIKEGFQLSNLYLGCFAGTVPRYNNTIYGDPFLSDKADGTFDGIIIPVSLKQIGPEN